MTQAPGRTQARTRAVVKQPVPGSRVRARKRILGFLTAVLIGTLAAALFSSPRLNIHTVELSGLSGLQPHEARLAQQAVSGLPGKNWFLAPAGQAAHSLETMPWVAHVALSRPLALRLALHLTPRTPFCLVSSGGSVYEMDSGGIPIRRMLPGDHGLPLIRMNSLTVIPGSRVSDTDLQLALQLLKSLAKAPLPGGQEIRVDRNRNIWLNMRDHLHIVFGQNDQADVKLRDIQKLYAADPDLGSSLKEINLSVPSAPSCVERSPAAVPAQPVKGSAGSSRIEPEAGNSAT